MNRSPLSWRWTTALIAGVLFFFLILVGYLDGAFGQQFEGEFWRVVQTPIIIIYILVIYPFMLRLWKPAIEAFRPLVSMSENEFNSLSKEISTVNRRREWAALFMGFLFVLLLAQPWLGVDRWTDAYHLATLMIMFGLLSWLIYTSVIGSRSIARLSKQNLKLDIFNTNLLAPVARMSLANSLAFVGGISISLVFQTQESLREWTSVVIYSVLVIATILIFYISMWSIHKIMARVKSNELELAQKYMADMSRKLKGRITKGQLEGMEELSSAVAGGAAYEKRVQEAQEWPFNSGIVRRLFASVLAPVSVYIIKIFSTLGINIG
jgi:MFS family permease